MPDHREPEYMDVSNPSLFSVVLQLKVYTPSSQDLITSAHFMYFLNLTRSKKAQLMLHHMNLERQLAYEIHIGLHTRPLNPSYMDEPTYRSTKHKVRK